MDKNSNPYLAAAQAIWHSGEDAEIIARQLAAAFVEIAREGNGADFDVLAEFRKFTGL